MAASCLIKLRCHLSPILQPNQDNTANKPHSVCEWLGCRPCYRHTYPENTLWIKNAKTSTKTSKHNIKGHWSQITMRNMIKMEKFENAIKRGIPATVPVMVKSNNALKQECTLQGSRWWKRVDRCSRPDFCIILRNGHSCPSLQQPPLWSFLGHRH